MNKYLLLVLLLIVSERLFGQVIVSGKVFDWRNQPLPGVNVVAKGTSTATVTDTNGFFKLKVAPRTNLLLFSSLRYKKLETNISIDSGFTCVVNIRLVKKSFIGAKSSVENVERINLKIERP
jgi:hypothetical protein